MAEQAKGEAPAGDLNTPGRHRVRVNGVSTSFTVSGEGRPVLFLHGWGLGHRTYSRPLATLAQRGCRVYTPSLPGFGGSAPLPASRRTLAGYADWAGSFLEALDTNEAPIVIGHSFGGGVAVGLAHRRPDAVRHLVLVNSVRRGRSRGRDTRATSVGALCGTGRSSSAGSCCRPTAAPVWWPACGATSPPTW